MHSCASIAGEKYLLIASMSPASSWSSRVGLRGTVAIWCFTPFSPFNRSFKHLLIDGIKTSLWRNDIRNCNHAPHYYVCTAVWGSEYYKPDWWPVHMFNISSDGVCVYWLCWQLVTQVDVWPTWCGLYKTCLRTWSMYSVTSPLIECACARARLIPRIPSTR